MKAICQSLLNRLDYVITHVSSRNDDDFLFMSATATTTAKQIVHVIIKLGSLFGD